MANIDAPKGLIPVRDINGRAYNGATNLYHVPATDATILGVGDPVVRTGEADVNGIPTVERATAASGTITGVIVAVELVTEESKNLEIKHRPASTLAYVHVADDPDLLFEIQEDSDGGALTAGAVGNTADLATVADANSITGRSTVELDSSTLGTGAQLKIRRLVQREKNDIGDHAKWLVQINEHTDKATTTAI